MIEIIFLSDGKISDTNIPCRISKEISNNSGVKIRFYSLSLIAILEVYKAFFIHIFNKKKLIINTHHFKGAFSIFFLKKIFNTNRFKNIKWFHTLHSEESRYFGIKRILVKLTYQKCDFIIGVNKEISYKWSKFLSKKNIKTVLNGISQSDYSIINKNKIEPNKLQILWVGRMENIKNPFLLIKSLYYLKSLRKIDLIIIGNGRLLKKVKIKINDFKSKFFNSNINIELYSKMERKEVLQKFGNSNIYVNTSFSEAFSITSLEAFVNPDCYLLLPNINTMKAIYAFDRVIFYEKNSPIQLAKEIDLLIEKIGFNQKVLDNRIFPSEFKLENCAKSYLEYYHESFSSHN